MLSGHARDWRKNMKLWTNEKEQGSQGMRTQSGRWASFWNLNALVSSSQFLRDPSWPWATCPEGSARGKETNYSSQDEDSFSVDGWGTHPRCKSFFMSLGESACQVHGMVKPIKKQRLEVVPGWKGAICPWKMWSILKLLWRFDEYVCVCVWVKCVWFTVWMTGLVDFSPFLGPPVVRGSSWTKQFCNCTQTIDPSCLFSGMREVYFHYNFQSIPSALK